MRRTIVLEITLRIIACFVSFVYFFKLFKLLPQVVHSAGTWVRIRVRPLITSLILFRVKRFFPRIVTPSKKFVPSTRVLGGRWVLRDGCWRIFPWNFIYFDLYLILFSHILLKKFLQLKHRLIDVWASLIQILLWFHFNIFLYLENRQVYFGFEWMKALRVNIVEVIFELADCIWGDLSNVVGIGLACLQTWDLLWKFYLNFGHFVRLRSRSAYMNIKFSFKWMMLFLKDC